MTQSMFDSVYIASCIQFQVRMSFKLEQTVSRLEHQDCQCSIAEQWYQSAVCETSHQLTCWVPVLVGPV